MEDSLMYLEQISQKFRIFHNIGGNLLCYIVKNTIR